MHSSGLTLFSFEFSVSYDVFKNTFLLYSEGTIILSIWYVLTNHCGSTRSTSMPAVTQIAFLAFLVANQKRLARVVTTPSMQPLIQNLGETPRSRSLLTPPPHSKNSKWCCKKRRFLPVGGPDEVLALDLALEPPPWKVAWKDWSLVGGERRRNVTDRDRRDAE